MRRDIVVNGRFLARRITGVERYGREILSLLGDSCRLETTRSQGVRGHMWEQFILPRRLNVDSILWSPANTGPLMIQRQALTIHDLSPLENPGWFRPSFAVWYRLFLPMLARRVKFVFVPSEYVREKVQKKFGLNHVIVAPNGVDSSIFHPGAKRQDHLPACYILFVGTLEPRKNLKGLLQAWSQIKDEFVNTWLVIAGVNGNVHKFVQLPQDIERVLFLGYVEEIALPGLYAGAMLFVLPSLDEGFGLPVLEAMACGTPVLVSNGGALPDVVGDAGLIFNLSEPHTLAASIKVCLWDHELRLSLKEKGLVRARDFSWRKTAELVWNTLNEI